MKLGNVARVVAVLGGCVAAVGSATSTTNTSQQADPQYSTSSPPPPEQMEPSRALGLWRSTFGAVKIEADDRNGGLQAGNVQGVWMYQRQGQDVVGVFWGNLRGNVLQFHWQEPDNPPLTGNGFLVFDPMGRQYSGRWWSDRHDRVGDWNGWRQDAQPAAYDAQPGRYGSAMYGSPYGGQGYAPPRQPAPAPIRAPPQPTYNY
jgi:hypothetical protein